MTALRYYRGNPLSAMRFAWLRFKIRRHTHCSTIDLLHLKWAIEQIAARRLGGSIVECGTWRGGSAALMVKTARNLGSSARAFLFDSFEGLPTPSAPEIDGEKAQGQRRGDFGWLAAKESDVRDIFTQLGIADDRIQITRGWFNETLPRTDTGPIALLHSDGDLYESTRDVLENLYDRVVPGGYIFNNDYGETWIGAKRATDEFIAKTCPDAVLTKIPRGGAYFQTPMNARQNQSAGSVSAR